MSPKSERCIQQVWKNATEQIAQQLRDETAETDARVLLQYCLDKSHSYLLTWPNKQLSETQNNCFQKALKRRLSGEPIAYIVGYREFWSMPLKVTPATLIPRPETELLVELAITRLSDETLQVLDMGTGSGAIALAIATEKPNCQILASDISDEALIVAKENADSLNIKNVRFIKSDWGNDIPQQKFDLIVSNPPYIEKNDPHLLQGDLRFEPDIALSANSNGLSDLISVIKFSKQRLKSGGTLLLEHGFDQHRAVADMFEEHGFSNINNWQDIFGNIRVSGGTSI